MPGRDITHQDFRVVNRQGRKEGSDQHHNLREHTIPKLGYLFDDCLERRKFGFLHQSGFQEMLDGCPKPAIDPNLRENQQWQRDFAERVLIQSSREGRKEAILWMSIKF